jgi:hypothetical protein
MEIKVTKLPKIIEYLELVAPYIPMAIYWGDPKTKTVWGANDICLELMGAAKPEDVIGKNPFEYYPKEIATEVVSHVTEAVKQRQAVTKETHIKDITTGADRYFNAVMAPLFDENDEIVGIIGTSTEITLIKEVEFLRRENQRQIIELGMQDKLKSIMDEFNNILQKHKFDILNQNIGKTKSSVLDVDVKLGKREREILYYLSLNKSPKEIASIISVLEKKNLAAATIQAVINKGLFIKFNVATTSQLIEKANALKLIPFTLDY